MDRERKIEIAKMILAVVGAAGFLAVALIAPNAVQMFGVFTNKKRYQLNFRFNRAFEQLKKRGLVKVCHGKVELTLSGKKELALYELKNKLVEKPKKWDGKWRIVAFDIWERRRHVRNAVREFLNKLGFAYLQNSIWVYPYNCREVVELLKIHYKARPAILYIVAESLENDERLKRKFGLEV